MKNTILLFIFSIFLTACGVNPISYLYEITTGKELRQNAPVPKEYGGMINPIEADEYSLMSGKSTFLEYCIFCHGESGMGDGENAKDFYPRPPQIAHTSHMLTDDHLFWRISEGGEEFGTAMVAFKGRLSEKQRWNVINYVRTFIPNGGMMSDGMMDDGMMGD